MAKFIIAVILILFALAGLWFSGLLQPLLPGGGPAAAGLATTTPQGTEQPVSDLPTAGTDMSDQALTQDYAAVGVQLQSLATDTANIDTSLADKAIAQEPITTAAWGSAAVTRAKDKASRELDRRIKALNEAATRANAMTKVTPEFKEALNVTLQNQITVFANLKVKIDGETDEAVLKTDIQTVTKEYTNYTLLLTQARLAAASDREALIINMLAEVGGKLQARLNAAQTSGADVAAFATPLSEMGSKLASAQLHAQTAIATSAVLVPDGGDAAKAKTNTTALKGAKTEVETARTDLTTAQKDADIIIKGLKQLGASATTTQTQ